MKFAIFGGSGFVGTNVIRFLTHMGHEAIGFSRSDKDQANRVDISNSSEFDNIRFVPDVIVNCASVLPAPGKTSRDPQFLRQLFLTNAIGGVNISNWGVKIGIPKIINCSTLAVIGKPWPIHVSEDHVSLSQGVHVGYGMSKITQEQLMDECIRESSTKLIHLRLSAVFGLKMPAEGIIFNLLNKFLHNENITLTDATKNSFDFINVDDVSRIIFNLATQDFKSGVFNVASGEEVFLNDLAQFIKEFTNSTSVISNTDTSAPPSRAKVDVRKLKNQLTDDFEEFIPFKEGLKQIISSYEGPGIR